MSRAFTSATMAPLESLGTYSETITGKPNSVPPVMPIPGNSGWPRLFIIILSASAVVDDIIHTPLVGALLAAMNAPNNACMSVRTLRSEEHTSELQSRGHLV